MCGLLLFLFVRMHIEPRFSFIPAETFPNIWEHRPLVLAGECVVSAYSQIHNAHMNRLHLTVEGGGRGMDHASTQIPLQFKLSTWSNGITALRDS